MLLSDHFSGKQFFLIPKVYVLKIVLDNEWSFPFPPTSFHYENTQNENLMKNDKYFAFPHHIFH